MTLTSTDIQSIKKALQPEFDKVRAEFSGEFAKVNGEFSKVNGEFAKVNGEFSKVNGEFAKVNGEFTKIYGEFAKVRAEAKQNFTTLNKKIDSLRRSNRKDHNLIIDIFDKRDLKLQNRVSALENKSSFPSFQKPLI